MYLHLALKYALLIEYKFLADADSETKGITLQCTYISSKQFK